MTGGFVAPGLSLRAYQHRRLLRVIVDCAVWFLALYAASLLRLDFDPARLDGFHIAILLPIAWAAQAIMGYYYGLYRGRWINGSFDEVAALGRTVFATTAHPPRHRPALAGRHPAGAGQLGHRRRHPGLPRHGRRPLRGPPDAREPPAPEAGRPPQASDHLRRRRGWRPHDPGHVVGRAEPVRPRRAARRRPGQAQPDDPGRPSHRRPGEAADRRRGVQGPGARDRGPDR